MIHALSVPTFNNPRRVALLVGAGALAIATGLVIGRILQIEQRAENRTVEFSASYQAYATLDALAQRADLIVVGHPIDQGRTHMVAQPVQQSTGFQPNQSTNVPADKSKLALGQVQPSAKATEPAPPAMDTPFTDFNFEVTRVLHGQVAAGAHLTVSQPGGAGRTPDIPWRADPEAHHRIRARHADGARPGSRPVPRHGQRRHVLRRRWTPGPPQRRQSRQDSSDRRRRSSHPRSRRPDSGVPCARCPAREVEQARRLGTIDHRHLDSQLGGGDRRDSRRSPLFAPGVCYTRAQRRESRP